MFLLQVWYQVSEKRAAFLGPDGWAYKGNTGLILNLSWKIIEPGEHLSCPCLLGFFVSYGLFGHWVYQWTFLSIDLNFWRKYWFSESCGLEILFPALSSAGRRAQECCFGMCGCSIFICTIFYWLCFLSYFESINLLNLGSIKVSVTVFLSCMSIVLYFFFKRPFFTPKIRNRIIVHSSDSACNCGICVWNSHCSCGISVYSPNNFFFFGLCCGRGVSAVSLANPAVAALCLEHDWSCIYHRRHGGWFI